MPENSRIIAVVLCQAPDDLPGDLPADQISLGNHVSVLQSCVQRLRKISEADAYFLLHPHDKAPVIEESLLTQVEDKDFTMQAAALVKDALYLELQTARKWASTCWRGGIAGTCIYDELRYFKVLLDLASAHRAEAIYLVDSRWPYHDPELADQMMRFYRERAEAPHLSMTQVPPGAAGILMKTSLLQDLHDNYGWVGRMLEYMPKRPQPDPITKDFFISIPHQLRNAQLRLIADSPRWTKLLQALGPSVSPDTPVAQISSKLEEYRAAQPWDSPKACHLELTVRRHATGPITPQHYLNFDREDMPLDTAKKIIDQLAEIPDLLLSFAGLGDPLLHPDILEIIHYARDKGIHGLHLKTDLIHSEPLLDDLMHAGLDVISVYINADQAATYQKVMGLDALKTIREHITVLLETRNKMKNQHKPFVVPHLVKVKDNVKDLESFFDRSVHFSLHGVIERFDTGNGLIPDLSPISMAATERPGMRAQEIPLVIHSDGKVVYKSNDWLAKDSLGHVDQMNIHELWQKVTALWQSEHMGFSLESLSALKASLKGDDHV